jgi:uncharacterized protein (UPF0276 family)
MEKIFSSVACNLDANILLASLPLFEKEKIQAIEWSFDALFKHEQIPSWFTDLIKEFGNENRLIGHGVYFSIFSGRWLPEQESWLKNLRVFAREFRFDHISEHFGFMTGTDFHKGAPISIPFTKNTLALGADRLKRIQDACQCPVGLENLAFSYSLEEVKKHGDFLSQLTEEINGFIILDLHNLYCQIHNFNISFEDIICLYPLEKVREIHISGGSWDKRLTRKGEKIRRDTHDDSVPDEVFKLLEATIPLCPNLKYVVLEQLGTALDTEKSRDNFRDDFLRMDEIVINKSTGFSQKEKNQFMPLHELIIPSKPLEDFSLFNQQQQLSQILENAQDLNHAKQLLDASDLKNSAWETEKWEPFMLETAMAIAQKWRDGFV